MSDDWAFDQIKEKLNAARDTIATLTAERDVARVITLGWIASSLDAFRATISALTPTSRLQAEYEIMMLEDAVEASNIGWEFANSEWAKTINRADAAERVCEAAERADETGTAEDWQTLTVALIEWRRTKEGT